jgi:hypothetical protein
MERQKEIWEKGEIWDDVYKMLEGAFNADGTINEGSELFSLLVSQEDFKAMSKEEQEEYLENMYRTISAAYGFNSNSNTTGSNDEAREKFSNYDNSNLPSTPPDSTEKDKNDNDSTTTTTKA